MSVSHLNSCRWHGSLGSRQKSESYDYYLVLQACGDRNPDMPKARGLHERLTESTMSTKTFITWLAIEAFMRGVKGVCVRLSIVVVMCHYERYMLV